MPRIPNGYQPATGRWERRADFDLLRRITKIEMILDNLSMIGGHASFSFNSATTEPIVGNQIRLNHATQASATRMWISKTSFDGMDVSVGLSRIKSGHQLYMQDFDDASKWVKYTVSSNPTDDGKYVDVPVTYHSGPGGVPFQKVEFQLIYPAAVDA